MRPDYQCAFVDSKGQWCIHPAELWTTRHNDVYPLDLCVMHNHIEKSLKIKLPCRRCGTDYAR